jgi:hypothetical protein
VTGGAKAEVGVAKAQRNEAATTLCIFMVIQQRLFRDNTLSVYYLKSLVSTVEERGSLHKVEVRGGPLGSTAQIAHSKSELNIISLTVTNNYSSRYSICELATSASERLVQLVNCFCDSPRTCICHIPITHIALSQLIRSSNLPPPSVRSCHQLLKATELFSVLAKNNCE